MEYLLVSLCECEANKISFSSCLQQPVIHLSNGCSSKVVMPGSSPAFWSCQDPPRPSGHARLLPGFLVMPGSSPAFWSCQDPSQSSGHARLLPSLLVMPSSSPAFYTGFFFQRICPEGFIIHPPPLPKKIAFHVSN